MTGVVLRADDAAAIAAVRAADDARIAAITTPDYLGLNTTLSDQLHYSHSEKLIETKAEFMASLLTHTLIYRRIDYKNREFTVVAPGVVLGTGRAEMEVGSKQMIFLVDLKFTAVWRLESDGHWRLFAWQSTRLREIVPLGPPTEVQPNRSAPPPPRN